MKLTTEQLKDMGYVEGQPGVYIRASKRKNGYPEVVLAKPSPKRIRQSSKPLMNKLEQEWFDTLAARYPNFPRPRAQAVRFKLCNGVHYTPDVFILDWPCGDGPNGPTAYEVKGKFAWDDAVVKLKMAAHEWPEVRWILVWKEGKQWKEQVVLP